MTKKEIARGLFMGLWIGIAATPLGFALAQIVPALPFNLANNTTADATQVMANFNQLLTNINTNSAKNGINSDITSLIGLTTPLAPGVGGTTTFTGGTSTGTGNAQVVATVVPNTFSLTVGSRVVFVAGNSNTGPTTINVSASGVKNVYRKTQLGISNMVGGEINIGDVVNVVYDGTQFQMDAYRAIVGETVAYVGSAPIGWAYADGSCLSSVTYTILTNIIGGSFTGGCPGGQFGLPDLRGRVVYGRDNMGGVSANRLTLAVAGCDGSILSNTCGGAAVTLAQANLPSYTLPNTLGVSRTGSVSLSTAANGVLNNQGVGGSANVTGGGGAYNLAAITLTDTQAWSATGSVTSGGSGTAFFTTQATQVFNYIIKL